MKSLIILILFISWSTTHVVSAAYQPTLHSPLKPDALAVTGPGNYAQNGAIYQLTQNISGETSPIFLGKDVILDLNGYTITFADANYTHIPNFGFEKGIQNWDISQAPSAKIEATEKVHVFIGNYILRLSAGEEIVSEYIYLPISNRSYFAMCGVISKDMKISLFVEDKSGQSLECFSTVGDSTKQCCPVLNRSPRLGGGFVIAHIYNQPAGMYRVRVRAETDCLVDHIDLRPAMDVGISVVENTSPYAHNDYLYNGNYCAFFDYTQPGSLNEPKASIPRVQGSGIITIKNGIIKSGATGVLSWGIQSTAQNVKIVLDNVKIISSGINTNAVDVPFASVSNCRFDINTPFIINRHVSEHAVVLRGVLPSQVFNCEFYGGQGCLTIKGKKSDVYNSLFVNRQMVTNHYCIMAMGDSSTIHHNKFEPEIGSGVEIYRHSGIKIYENEFRIEASPPTCEYGHEEYSTTAIRLADYGALPGSANGCSDNQIYKNKFYIVGKDYPQYPDYVPMAWAFFQSVSGGETYVYDNDITVFHKDPDSKAEAAAIYIGGANNGGIWENNRITTNVPAAWIASRYGSAAKAKFIENLVKRFENCNDFKPFRMGWNSNENSVAQDIEFLSNNFEQLEFGVDKTEQNHSYSVSWTLTIKVLNEDNQVVPNSLVFIKDVNGKNVMEGKTDSLGQFQTILKEYDYRNKTIHSLCPYTVCVKEVQQKVSLDSNLEIIVKLKGIGTNNTPGYLEN